MRLEANNLAFAVAVVVAAVYAACWALVAVAPEPAMTVTEDMLHMRMESVTWNMTARSLFLGMAAWAVAAGAAAWLVAVFYNRLCRPR